MTGLFSFRLVTQKASRHVRLEAFCGCTWVLDFGLDRALYGERLDHTKGSQ